MSREAIIIKNNSNSKIWEIFIVLLKIGIPIIYQEYKDDKEKKQLVQNLEDAKKIINDACSKLGITNLTELPNLPNSKSFIDLIKFYQETPSDWKEQLKKSQRAKKKEEIKNCFLIAKLQQIEEKLTKEKIRRIRVENKLTEFEKQKENYFNELSWKRFGEDMLIEYRMEKWVNEQMEDKKNQELLDSIDYKLWEEY